MMTKRMENWDAGDFARSFRKAVHCSDSAPFQRKFGALAESMSVLDSEFCRETVGCGRELSSVMEELQSIGGRVGYCQRERGFPDECNALYQDVDRVIEHVDSLRGSCIV